MDRAELHAMEKRVVSDMLKNLDDSLEQGSLEETLVLVDRWNFYQRKWTDPIDNMAASMGLGFVSDIIRDKGLRLPALEEAMDLGRVTIQGNVRFKRDFLKVLRGEKPLKIDNCSLKLIVHF